MRSPSAVVAVFALASASTGIAAAGVSRHVTAPKVIVKVTDTRLMFLWPTGLQAGTVTLFVVNRGKLTHALAIAGTGLQPKRTPALSSGKSAKLTVTVEVGSYRIWDPVRSSMKHATVLKVRASGGLLAPATVVHTYRPGTTTTLEVDPDPRSWIMCD